MLARQRPLVTIICPVFNEEQAIPVFHQRLMKSLEPLRHRYDFELLFTNNRSTDKTLEVIKNLRLSDPRIQVLTLSRNFGYQASVQAGMAHAYGDALLTIDVDCEDPPEMISQFVDKWEDGYDVVYGVRQDRPESWIIKKLRNVFYRLLRAMADMDIILYMAEFALITSPVRDSIINNSNTFPFLRSEIGYAGFERYGIEYKRQERVAGKTHYNFQRMSMFAIAGILTSSTFLMRLAAYSWPILAVLVLSLMGADVFFDSTAGFRWAVTAALLYISFFLCAFGIYIARIYKNGIGRPVYIVDWKQSAMNRSPVSDPKPVA